MTDPDAPPPTEPKPPEYEPGAVPVEEPPTSPPVDPGDDRPYGVASARTACDQSPLGASNGHR